MDIAHRKALRRIINIPHRTHNNITYALSNSLSFNDIAITRFISLVTKLHQVDNKITNNIAHVSELTKLTHSSSNIYTIKTKFPNVTFSNIKQHAFSLT